jgi:hypothetical protein
MTTGTIIFIVVLVLQAVIRAAAKAAEKKKKLEAAQVSAAGVMRKVDTEPQQPRVPRQDLMAEFVEVGQSGVQTSHASARPAFAGDDGDETESDRELDGEATGGYLRARVQQIHSRALGGRHAPAGVPAQPPETVTGSQAPVRASSLRKALSDRAGLRDGFVMTEVLGPPVSLKQPA